MERRKATSTIKPPGVNVTYQSLRLYISGTEAGIRSNSLQQNAENLLPRTSTKRRRVCKLEVIRKISSNRMGYKKGYTKIQTPQKRNVFIALPSMVDRLSHRIDRNFKLVIRQAYSAERLRLLRTTKSLGFQNHWGCLADPTVSRVVHQFTYSWVRHKLGRRMATEKIVINNDSLLWLHRIKQNLWFLQSGSTRFRRVTKLT